MQWLFISASPRCSVTLTSHIKVSCGFAFSACFACLFQSFNSAVIQLSWNNTWITAVGNHAKILLSTRLWNCLFPLQMHWHLGHIFWLIPVPYNVAYKQMRKNNTKCTGGKKKNKEKISFSCVSDVLQNIFQISLNKTIWRSAIQTRWLQKVSPTELAATIMMF